MRLCNWVSVLSGVLKPDPGILGSSLELVSMPVILITESGTRVCVDAAFLTPTSEEYFLNYTNPGRNFTCLSFEIQTSFSF